MKTTLIFPIPLLEAELPQYHDVNRDLIALLRRREESDRDYAPYSTVRRGWQSAPDLLADPHPAVLALRGFMERAAVALFGTLREAGTLPPKLPREPLLAYSGWGVILRQGGEQAEHVHRRADLVAVYYVAAGEAGEGGELAFCYPRSGGASVYSIWEGTRIKIRPRPGLLLMFPAFLPHHVEPYHGAGERISVNADITLVPPHRVPGQPRPPAQPPAQPPA